MFIGKRWKSGDHRRKIQQKLRALRKQKSFFFPFISTGGSQLMLNQWIDLLVTSAMSQSLKLQLLLLLLQSSTHNLSQLIVLSCLSQHITSLHFLKVSN